MNLSDFQRMFTYNDWANREVLASFRKNGTGAKSVRYMAHVLAAEQLWLDRLDGHDQKVAVWPEPDINFCETLAAELAGSWQNFLGRTGEQGLSRTITYKNSKGENWASRVDDVLMHVIMHAAYHRGQIASDMRAAGLTPVLTDFIHAVRQNYLEKSA